jgi:CRISPR-associated endonuclease Csn1
MQILESSKYNAKQEIENFNRNREKLVDSVDDFFQSNPLIPSFIKRSFNEAVKCVDEYIDCIGCLPEKIFIETTRFIDRNKSEKPKKKKIIKDKLTKINDAENRTKYNIKEILNNLDSKDDSDIDEKLTLYFYQLGKDMYSEKPIELDRLMDYEVDHIVPQSYTINNSIDNKVLVKRDSNQRKLNQYPFVNSISSDVQGF